MHSIKKSQQLQNACFVLSKTLSGVSFENFPRSLTLRGHFQTKTPEGTFPFISLSNGSSCFKSNQKFVHSN